MTTINGNTPPPAATTPAPAMPDVTFTEAPSSINLRFNYRGAQGLQLTLRNMKGWTLLDNLDKVMDKLEKMGATFGPDGGNTAAARPPVDANAPMCPTHNAPMKKSQHGPGYFCPQRVAEAGGGADGSKPIYCKAKAG